MQNNFSSADSNDLAFARSYQWSEPVHDLQIAMQILTCPNIGCECEEDPCAQSESEFDRVRCALASHPCTPPSVLAHLVNCDIPFILERIAENPNTDMDTLRRLSRHERAAVRAAVAENTDAHSDVLRALASDESIDVRYSLADNANVPSDILQLLTADENPYVAYRAQTTIARMQASTLRVDMRRLNLHIPNIAKQKRVGS